MDSRPQLSMVFIYGAVHTHWVKKGFGLSKKHVFVASGLVIIFSGPICKVWSTQLSLKAINPGDAQVWGEVVPRESSTMRPNPKSFEHQVARGSSH